MSSKGTPHRPIRISDDLWAKAQAKAAQEGTTASAKARDLLEAWIEPRCLCDHTRIVMGSEIIREMREADPRCPLHNESETSMDTIEWGIFRKDDPTGIPAENMTYTTREAAEKTRKRQYLHPEIFETRGRVIGPWDVSAAD